MVSRRFVIANWKMVGSLLAFSSFISDLSAFLRLNHCSFTVVVCPPYSFLNGGVSRDKLYHLGAQDCSMYSSGPFTGEVAASMLKDVGCEYVIVGHSERRIHVGDSNGDVLQKAHRAVEAGLVPIICIGELQKECLVEQLVDQLAECLPKSNVSFIVAYEPCWAIGNPGFDVPDREHMLRVVDLIKRYNAKVPIVYGGSVNFSNVHKIMACPGLDGVLLGRAATDFALFSKIMTSLPKT